MVVRRSLASLTLLVLAATTASAADPVGTWDLVGNVRVSACARGRCQSRHATSNGIVAIAADGTYTAPNDVPGCYVPDEQGTWTAGKRGRYLLRPSNTAELVSAIADCLGVSGVTLSGRFLLVFKPHADGTTATARATFVGHGSYRGVGFTASAVGHYQGTRSAAFALDAAPRTSGASATSTIVRVLHGGAL